MTGRVSGLLALVAVGLALAGCQTTQQKSAELERQALEEQRREQAAETTTGSRTSGDGEGQQ